MSRFARWIAAAVILGVLLAFAVVVWPHYRRHLAFERALDALAQQAEGEPVSADILRTRVQDQGARLGLDVRAAHVRLRRTSDGLRLEVRYPVRIEMAFYTVDLHFRARGGR